MTDPEDRRPSTAGEDIETHSEPSLGSFVRKRYTVREGNVIWGHINIVQSFGPEGSTEGIWITFFDDDVRTRK